MKTSRADSSPNNLLLFLSVIILTAHLLGSYVFRSHWWGLNGLSFLPPAGAMGLVLFTVAGIVLVVRRPEASGAAGSSPLFATPVAVPPLVLAYTAAAWLFRLRHYFLGDGLPLISELLKGTLLPPAADSTR